MYRICLYCYWRDRNNYQCFDGHLQYKSRQHCPGFCDEAGNTAEDTFMYEQAKIAYEEYRRRKNETNRIKRLCIS